MTGPLSAVEPSVPPSPASRPRVLHVGKFYPPAPGGMERVVQLLCEGERSTIDSRVLAAHHRLATVREVWQGVPVTRVGSVGAIGSVGVCPLFPVELARAQRDITVLHEPNPLALVADWAAVQGGPLVVWFHSEVIRPRWKYRLMYRPFLRRVLDRAARVVVSSPRLAESAAELGDYQDKCTVIPFGIDPARLSLTPERVRQAAQIRGTVGDGLIVFVGRLVPYKGLDVLLTAMQDVDATAVIVGDGPERPNLESLAAQLGVTAKVRFAGSVSDDEVAAHLHACDVFVLPSVTRAETFGVVQLEAMACGRPVVSTDLPTGVPWVNRHDETGVVVPPKNAWALATALNRLIGDASERERLGRGGVARVAAEFTIPRMVERTTALYAAVLQEAGGA